VKAGQKTSYSLVETVLLHDVNVMYV